MELKTTRPKIKISKIEFERDLIKLLRKYNLFSSKGLINSAKIIIDVEKLPFIEIKQYPTIADIK